MHAPARYLAPLDTAVFSQQGGTVLKPHAPTNTSATSVMQNMQVPNVKQHPSIPETSHPQPLNHASRHDVLPSPIRTQKLEYLLKDYPNCAFLIQGFTKGFRLHYHGPQQSYEIKNNKSVLENEKQVFDKVLNEVSLGRIAGPFLVKPFDNFHVSPLGRVPKKEEGKFRIIHDLSQPRGYSVNNFISDEYASVRYETFDDVVKLVVYHGAGALIAKCDIADAFRIIPVNPADYHLLGFKLCDKYYFYDKVLPMGCRVSCQIFEEFSKAVRFIVKAKFHFDSITGILDDFILVGKAGTSQCMRGLNVVIEVAKLLGIPLKPSKTVLPSTRVIVFGILIDTLEMSATVPRDKVQKALDLIECLMVKTHVQLYQVQKLTGLLNFMCKCVRPGRAFMRRLWDLTCIDSHTNDKSVLVPITNAAKQDMKAWKMFLMSFNGSTLLTHEIWMSAEVLHLFTDSCQTIGYAGVFKDKWFCGLWESQFKTCNILILEFVPIVIALHLFGNELKNKYIILHTDNMALMHVINNQTSKCSKTMALVRKLVVYLLLNNINVRAEHIPGYKNTLADSLSRFKVKDAKREAPWLSNLPLEIPIKLQPCSLLHPL